MPDNVTLYSNRYDELPDDRMESLAGGVEGVTHRREGASHVYEWAGHCMRCNPMPPERMRKHLDGFVGFAHHCAGGAADPDVISRIRSTKLVLGVVVDPGHDREGVSEELIGRMIGGLDPLVVLPSGVYDASGELLFGPPAPPRGSAPTDGGESGRPPRGGNGSELAREAVERRERSLQRLRAEGVPVMEDLPVVETEDEARVRSVEEIVERAIALTLVAVRGEGLERERTLQLAHEQRARFTPKEQQFLAVEDPTDLQRAQFSWRYEALAVLQWALGMDVQLGRPDHIVDAGAVVRRMKDIGVFALRSWTKRRPEAEILDAADLAYRYHWAVVDARLAGREPPAGLDPGVVYERHYALNWLIGHEGQAWDDVSTDT